MKSLGEVLKLSTEYLEKNNVFRARRTAEELIAFILKIKRIELYMQFDRPLEEAELSVLRDFLKRKVQGEPLEYILGEVSFLDCRIFISNNVIIPRQETEILASKVIAFLKESPEIKTVWDVCTGSGTIGISLKKACPHLLVTLSDISPEALAVAKSNAEINGVEVELLLGDLLEPFGDRKADMIICNPPYISEEEYKGLDDGVKLYEPKTALVGGEEGTEFYQRLNALLPRYLTKGGQVVFEIGMGQGEKVVEIFSQPCWKKRRIEKDWSGKDRFFFLEFE